MVEYCTVCCRAHGDRLHSLISPLAVKHPKDLEMMSSVHDGQVQSARLPESNTLTTSPGLARWDSTTVPSFRKSLTRNETRVTDSFPRDPFVSAPPSGIFAQMCGTCSWFGGGGPVRQPWSETALGTVHFLFATLFDRIHQFPDKTYRP